MSNLKHTEGPRATLALDAKAFLGEGALWHPKENKLYWIDIEGRALHIYDPSTKKEVQFSTIERIGTVVPIASGGALVALQNGIHKMDTETGQLTFLTNPLTDDAIRFNDGKCDPAGRFWVGTVHLNEVKGAASLYRFDTDQTIHQVLDDVTISNGIVWSADRQTMYYIDTPTSCVQAFDYNDTTGTIKNGRIVITIPPQEGHPDGMTIDAEGRLWIALWGGSAVGCWDPSTGRLLQKIQVPVPNVSSCAFGGEDLRTLYITTARKGLTDEQLKKFPLSGGLFAGQPGIIGVPAQFYKGEV